MSDTWLHMTAADLGRGIGRGEIDPVELTETYLEAIAASALTPRIYARTTEKRARAEATAARVRAKAGMRRGILDGVPISWKDLFDTAGVATEAGTALLKGRVPEHDARVLVQATRAGLVCLGKTHMTELAFSGLGLNPVTATPPCVNDPDAVPGGSSSGAATSVAFGLAAAGIGSDTGGSVRVPSAWNDLTGLKTTSGLLPLDGVVPLVTSFDTVGPLCRTVEDCGLLLAAMSGGVAPDLAGADLSGRRFMVLETVALDDVRDAPAEGFERAVAALGAAGATIERRKVPAAASALELDGVLFAPEAYAQWRDEIEAQPDLMHPPIRERFRSGAKVLASDQIRGWKRMLDLRREYYAATASYDAVLLPSSPILPPNAARLLSDNDYFVRESFLALRNTRIGNILGVCALTIPTGVPSAGLMVMAPPFDEARLLRIGAAIEKALT